MMMLLAALLSASSSYCDETPTAGPASVAVGSPQNGSVEGAVRFVDTKSARVMPARHKARCLSWGTARLVDAIHAAAERVAREHPGGAPLGVGNIGRARGGSIREFSHSHNAGRDADLAFYLIDGAGQPIAADDLVALDPSAPPTVASRARLDVARTWTLVDALLSDARIDVQWLFVSPAVKRVLLAEGARRGSKSMKRAEKTLHQPSDAPPHDDHIHVRIRCGSSENRCR